MRVKLYKAFTQNPLEGNPAGVIFDADDLTVEKMIEIAKELGFSESVFIVKPTGEADYRFRFMTPTQEVDACGHATLAASKAILDIESFEKLSIQTNAGIVEISVVKDRIMMKMAKAEINETNYEKEDIAKLLNINPDEILDLPIVTASVGSPKLIIPIKSLSTVQSIKSNFDAMIEFCGKHPVKGFYPFTTETINKDADFHARQFNPAAGIFEDPITGIAAGALALYVRKYNLLDKTEIIIEQGYELKKPGKIYVSVIKNKVYVGGYAINFIDKSIKYN